MSRYERIVCTCRDRSGQSCGNNPDCSYCATGPAEYWFDNRPICEACLERENS